MLMLGLNKTTDQLTMENSVRWNGHVLRREYGHVLRTALDFEVEGERKKGRPKRTWKTQVVEESVKVGFRREDALCRSKWRVDVTQIAAGVLVLIHCSFQCFISKVKHRCNIGFKNSICSPVRICLDFQVLHNMLNAIFVDFNSIYFDMQSIPFTSKVLQKHCKL